MDMPLAYRIATMNSSVALPSAGPRDESFLIACDRIGGEVTAIRAAPKFRLDNVAEFYALHERNEWDGKTHIPNWMPPYPLLFAECNRPPVWNIDGKMVAYPEGAQFGFLMDSGTIGDELPYWQKFVNVEGYESVTLDESCLVAHLSPWGACSSSPHLGRPFRTCGGAFLFIAPDGRLIQIILCLPPDDAEDQSPVLRTYIHILGLGLSFCHCKNVKVSEGKAANWSPHWDQSGKARRPTLRFHTIDIDPMRETLRREGRSDEVGMQKALHICRGHFATYSPEHPLFGKYVGTFWKPSHVRGTADQGVIVADYAIHSTNPKETPDA